MEVLLVFLVGFVILLFLPFKIKIYFEYVCGPKYKIIITDAFSLIKKEVDSTYKEENNKKSKYKESTINDINPKEYVDYFISKGKIDNLNLQFKIGIDDPFILSIVTGVCWTIVNIFIGVILKDKDINDIKNKNIDITPIFNEDIFEINFHCIIKVKLVYIITAYIRIIKERKVGVDIVRASN